MKNLFSFLLVLSAIFCCINKAATQTAVPGGNVSGTWTLSGSPYLINGNIFVQPGQTLTIEPGVLVEFQGTSNYKYYLQIYGCLLAVGTETDSITFTSLDSSTGWYGIRFDSIGTIVNDSSKLFFCKIHNVKTVFNGVIGFWDFQKAIVSNCLLSNNSGDGSVISCGNSSPIIQNNTIQNNSTKSCGGISCSNSNSLIINNKISNNTSLFSGGISCGSGSQTIMYNEIISNSSTSGQGGGIKVSYSSANILYNLISNNSASGGGGGIMCYYSSPFISENTITFNIAGDGGGIYCTGLGNIPIISKNTISNNASVSGDGGGIHCDFSNSIITNNIITNDSAKYNGGGIYCNNSSPTITDNIISHNCSNFQSGGGICCEYSSNANISNNTISNNYSFKQYGGGIYSENSNPIINNNTITYNSTYNYGGGGIACVSTSNPEIFSNIISHNSSFNNNEGGGIFSNQSNPIIYNNSISNNFASYGGGIRFAYGKSIIINNVIYNNSVSLRGGGVSCTSSSSSILQNNTITNNSSSYGGGIYFNNCSPTLNNCIIWGNIANNTGYQVYLQTDNSDPIFFNCDIQGDSSAFGLNGFTYMGAYLNNIDSDPIFVEAYDSTSLDWSLQPGSPCINAGTPDTTGLFLPTTDIEGNPRVSNGRIDIGAYEHLGTSAINSTIDDFISIYPNPNNGKFLLYLENYESKNYTVEIYDITGQIIYSENYENKVVLAENIDISEFESGVYFVKISNGNTSVNKSIVVCN